MFWTLLFIHQRSNALIPGCAGAEAQVSHLKATVQEQKTKYTQLLNEKALGERDAAALLAAAENRAAELEAQMKAEQSKKEEYSNKLTFYGSAYQKLQGKLTGGHELGMCCVQIWDVTLDMF